MLASPATRLEIGVENSRLNVTGKRVRNCVVPCYFVACGLMPGADPPGAWKPCFSAQVRGGGDSTVMTFEDSAGRALRQFEIPGGKGTVSIPLYEQPNHPYPAGTYRIRTRGGNGAEGALVVTIE